VVEIYKEVGLPEAVVDRFDVRKMAGTHGIGHTRMATESAVTTMGAHPFSTGADQCLVHNGSLSNHNNVRRELIREGMKFETENDTEVAAAYLTWRLREGDSLEADNALVADHRDVSVHVQDLERVLEFLEGHFRIFAFVIAPRSEATTRLWPSSSRTNLLILSCAHFGHVPLTEFSWAQ